jgi:hypothetical protein
MLEFPKTIRIPQLTEVPNDPEIIERLQEVLIAPINEGYTIKKDNPHGLPFVFYAEINVNNSRLWEVVQSVLKLLPEICCCVYNSYDTEAVFGEYMQKKDILATLSDFRYELSTDCDIEFGILFNSETMLTELYVTESKYIRFWGMDELPFKDLMKELYLPENAEIRFIDEFPKVVVPLTTLDPSARSTELVLQELYNSFGDANEE